MSKIHRFTVSFGLIVLVLVVAGLGAWGLTLSRKQSPKADFTKPAQLVEIVEMVPGDHVEWLRGYGTALPDQAATIRAEVNAAVMERVDDLEPGRVVKEGQVLLRLDDRQYRERLQQAEQMASADNADLEQLQVQRENLSKMIAIAKDKLAITQKEYDRVAALFKNKNASESEYNMNELSLQNAIQALQDLQNTQALLDPQELRLKASRDARLREAEVARIDLARCTVKAPFAGHVEEVFVEKGDVVLPGSQLIKLIDSSHIEIPVELPASNRDLVNIGDEVVLSSDARTEVSWTGSIVRISPTVDESSRTFAVWVEVDNSEQDHFLMPGVFVNARIHGPVLKDVLVLPRTAVKQHDVYVMADGKASIRKVRTGRTLEDRVVIDEGLQAGDSVIVTNLDMLYEGAEVKILNAESKPAAIASQAPADVVRQ